MKRLIDCPDLKIIDEMGKFHHKEGGKMEASVGHDDLVMALALANWGCDYVSVGHRVPRLAKNEGRYSGAHLNRLMNETDRERSRRLRRDPYSREVL